MKDIAKGIAYLGVFAIPFIPLIISNSMFFPFITGKNFTFRVIVEVIFAAWVILACYDSSYRPKFSWILGSFTALLVVMFFANMFGESPLMGFWSNFERMEGYVTLVHAWMYMVVAGSVLTTDKLWNRFFNVTFASSLILTLYAFAQLSGEIVINQGGWRLDGTLGNSAYMAIYMLFNVFLALLMLVRTDSKKLRYVYGALAVLFTYLLVQTATRGTILGLVGGLGITTTYIALFTKNHPTVRKFAAGALITLVVLVGLFVTFRKSEFIQSNPYLGRVANITLNEGNVRFKVWNMAYEGFKERPLLGWGQSNFNYIFNQEYDPSLYFAESWYDRVHNIVFDWLVAGGILGALAYFAIYFSAIYYLFVRPLMRHDEVFTVAERGVLLGLLAGYLFHNLFVFDNIVSYIYYGTILAFIHARIGLASPKVTNWKTDQRVIEQVIAPVVAVALFAGIYFVNLPGIHAAGDIINAFRATTVDGMIGEFKTALGRNSFGDQEIREQMTRRVQDISQAEGVTPEQRQELIAFVESELLKQIEEKPNDARAHVFIASFYRMLGDSESLDKSIAQLAIARSLSPRKQQIILEQGLAHLQKQEFDEALGFFKEAYELDTSYGEARMYYAVAAVYAGKMEIVDEVIVTDADKDAFALNDQAVQAVYAQKNFPFLISMFETRIAKNPTDPQLRTSYAYILNESGDAAKAIEALQKAGEEIPTFRTQAEEFMKQIVSQNLGIELAQ